MAWLKALWLTGLFGFLLMDYAPRATAAEWGRGDWDQRGEGQRRGCRNADRIHIQDLDMSPDPVVEGQRIRAWRVRIRLDGNRDCSTEIEIREGRDTIARVRRTTLRPGANEIQVEPIERYHFQGKEHCFRVVLDLDGTRREADAARRFCARQRTSWSMSERGDARGYGR